MMDEWKSAVDAWINQLVQLVYNDLVNISLAAVNARMRNAREERDQFYEANDQIVAYLKTMEDELSRSMGSCTQEADFIRTWMNFLGDIWALQSSTTENKEKEVSAKLERHERYFVNLVILLLSAYENDLKPSIYHFGKYVENLKSLDEGSTCLSAVGSKELHPRKILSGICEAKLMKLKVQDEVDTKVNKVPEELDMDT